eukprot:CAMPEP_0168745690 /NCGR_PEP_ID=MMETSP0724-20121128/14752_1 /TAXON_ID=265536 /ORGANISM="Amphiprora sp., Strain CCMP467" /LENGTH=473 /DNA_ID=CAMNT_0008793419 /DNA_START=203 /DNA_END=1624 /DNA_ORIENTATION=-
MKKRRHATSKRESVCFRKKSATRNTVPVSAVFAFLLPCIVHGPALTSATVFSQELRSGFDHQDQSLLFWSAFEFSVDAALQYVGPIDTYLRGSDAPSQNCLDPHNTSPLACMGAHQAAPFLDDLISSVDDMIGDLVKNLSTLFQDDSNSEGQSHSNNSNNSGGAFGLNKSIPIPRGGARFGGSNSGGKFSLFQKGDGSERDPDGIPTRFLEMQKGNREAALKAVESTVEWRKEHDIDTILTRPHTTFDLAKTIFPHYFLGRDKNGDVLFLQRPALTDLQLAKKNGIKLEDLLMHYVYVNEYLWQILEGDKPLGTMTSIIDLTGLQLSVLRKRDLILFAKLTVSTMDNHFPQRAHKTLVINAPKWFNTLYKLVSPLMRESTKAKIEIHSRGKKQDEVLKKYLSQEACDSLPKTFWAKKKGGRKKDRKEREGEEEAEEKEEEEPAGSSFDTKLEQELRSYVVAHIKDAGKKMATA